MYYTVRNTANEDRSMSKEKKRTVGRPEGLVLDATTLLKHKAEDKEKWQGAANGASLSLSKWIRLMLNAAAETD